MEDYGLVQPYNQMLVNTLALSQSNHESEAVNCDPLSNSTNVSVSLAPFAPLPSFYGSQAVLSAACDMTESELDRKLSTDTVFKKAYYDALS